MPPRRIVCPDCGESVPSGRLSCPACGALLASVAGGAARPAADVNDAPSEDAVPEEGLAVDPAAMSPARIQTQALPEPAADAPAPRPSPPADRGPAIPLPPSSIRQTEVDGPPSVGATPIEAAPIPTWTAEVDDLGYDDRGYVPPPSPPAAETLPGPMPADAAAALSTAPAAPATNETNDAIAGMETARMDQALGYATAAGAALVAFGMFMPWARVVIGSSGASGLFDTWGLAGPGHVLLLIWALVVLIVSVLPNRIPVSVRSGLAGLVLGVFSLGLVWPYLVFGPLGAGIGVWVVALGALVLTATGIVSAWRDRHAAGDGSV